VLHSVNVNSKTFEFFEIIAQIALLDDFMWALLNFNSQLMINS